MRAAVIAETGQDKVDIRDDVELVDVGPGEARVQIKATGVCHSDISAMDGTIPQPAPCVLGHEGSGVVVEVGQGVTDLEAGDHVVAAFIAACGACRVCLGGQPNLCMEMSIAAMGTPKFVVDGTPYFGYAGTGTFAEESVMNVKGLVKIPKDVPFEVGALIGCGVTTGVGAAINTADITVGDNVCIIGAGGVGVAVTQGARIAGAAEIVVVDMLESKAERAKQFGATHAVTPDGLEDLKNELTAGMGFDHVFDVVGAPATIRQSFDLTRRGGECIVVGVGGMDAMVEFSAFELFFSEKNLKGSVYGSANVRRDFPRLLNLWRNGRLDLEGMISRRLTIDDINDAFEAMATGDVIRQVVTF